jgi:hypothetical protein
MCYVHEPPREIARIRRLERPIRTALLAARTILEVLSCLFDPPAPRP